MRRELQKRDGARFRCRATVGRFGSKTAFRGPPVPTVLLRDIVDAGSGAPLADHLWFDQGKWSSGLVAGDTVEFDARATDYIKGYRGRREVFDAPVSRDWKLQRPTRLVILTRQNAVASTES